MATSKARRAWDDLNDRQRTYLTAIYDADQANEEAHRAESARDWSKTPAREWRRLDFNGPYSRIAPILRHHCVYDSGAGSTLSALCTRGLIDTATRPGLLSDPVDVWITREGRAAARAGLGVGSVGKARWALSQWLWRQMAVVAKAGEQGLPVDDLFGSAELYLSTDEGHIKGNRPYLVCVKSTVTYTPRDFHLNPYPGATATRTERHYRFSEQGRAHYVEYVAQYRELYPDIDAPDLAPDASG